MELDDMKETWLNLNKKLEHQQVLNEKLIQQIANEQSENRLGKIVNFEIVGQVLNWGLLLYVLMRYQQLDSTLLQISAIGLLLIVLVLSYLSYLLYQKAAKIDIQKHQLIEVLNNMADFKKYCYNYIKWATIIAFFEVLFIIPLIVKLVHHKNILDHLSFFSIPIFIALTIGIVLAVVIYNQLYKKNIEAVEMTLEDLKEFGK